MLDETEATPGDVDGAASDAGVDDALLSRLRLIEERPLDERADAYTRIHSELVEVLEGQDDRRQDD
jgi:hypothetical protein